MYLFVVLMGEWLHKYISVVSTCRVVVSASGYYCFVELFGLTICRRVIRCRREVFGTKKAANSCKEFGNEARAVVYKEKRRDAVQHGPLVKEYICKIRRCCL